MKKMEIQPKQNPFEVLGFNELCDYYGLLDPNLLTILSIDKRTLKNWHTKNKAPAMALKLITLYNRGFLAAEWDGFYIDGEYLHSPTGQRLSAGEIMGWFYKAQMIRSLRQTNDALRKEIKSLEDKLETLKQPLERVETLVKIEDLVLKLQESKISLVG